MKTILTAAAAAALLAAPALAQTPSTQTAYEQQIRAIYQQIDSLPGAGTGSHEREALEWQAQIIKAEAHRNGVLVQVPPQVEATAQAR